MKYIFISAVYLLLFTGDTFAENLMSLNWKTGFSKSENEVPKNWMNAKVPGAVQLDYAMANTWGPYWYADNWKEYAWMEDVYWWYKAEFSRPELSADQRVYFISKGIDYEFNILFNGQPIHYQEGMFTPVRIDLTELLREKNEIWIQIFPAPKVKPFPVDRSQADRSVKPAVSYGWDWHPRLIPLGIWDETLIVIRNESMIEEIDFNYSLNENLDSAHIKISVHGKNLIRIGYSFRLTDKDGVEVISGDGIFKENRIEISEVVKDFHLWWSWDQGEPYLYNFEFLLIKDGVEIHSNTRKIGFRKVRLVMNEGSWNVDGFPKSRSNPPITLELNGRNIFCKGTNWVNPEIFPGIIKETRYAELLDLARNANFNLLRCWGGAIVNKDSFFELCDELGIMVWQDFPLACNPYEGTSEYLHVLEQEAVSVIKRLKPHSSLVIWCGGNELFNSWSGMTDQSLALRLLNSLTFRLDPSRPFLMTSPVMGMGHGHYVFRDPQTGLEVFQWMPEAKNTAYTEFGMPGPSGVEVLKTFIPEEQLWPPRPGTVWETHHAYKAWVGNTWLMQDMIEGYFGPAQSLEELVAWGQLIQCEGYKCIYEEARRQKPYCSMALNWCFNEPWPTAANNSLVNWPLIPKPALDAVGASCRPALTSARIPKFSWSAGEEFSVDLYLLNDSPEPVKPGKLRVILSGDYEMVLLEWDFPEVPANQNLAGPTARIKIPDWEGKIFDLVLSVENQPELNSEYSLVKKQGRRPVRRTTSTLNQ